MYIILLMMPLMILLLLQKLCGLIITILKARICGVFLWSVLLHQLTVIVKTKVSWERRFLNTNPFYYDLRARKKQFLQSAPLNITLHWTKSISVGFVLSPGLYRHFITRSCIDKQNVEI